MEMLDNGDWKLCRNEPDDPKQDDSIRLTISNRAITLSPKAKTTLAIRNSWKSGSGRKTDAFCSLGKARTQAFQPGKRRVERITRETKVKLSSSEGINSPQTFGPA